LNILQSHSEEIAGWKVTQSHRQQLWTKGTSALFLGHSPCIIQCYDLIKKELYALT